MKIGLAQIEMAWEDRKATRKSITAMLERDGVDGCDWLVFPEMTLSGYSMNPEKTSLDDGDLEFFRDLARKYGAAVTFGGVLKNQNHCMTFDKTGALISDYAKAHLFSYAGEEKIYSSGGDSVPFPLLGNTVVPAICYDLRFPYQFWKHASGVQFLVVIASWPASRALHWNTLLRARAIENQAFVVGVNRSGNDPRMAFAGGSVIFGPAGEEILIAPEPEGLYRADVDPQRVAAVRAAFPFMPDRRSPF